MSGIGHNGGPSMERGHGFRKVAWAHARRALLPSLPFEVVRVRVARARRLGLDYTSYATIRATSGRDVVAFLFSANALDLSAGRIVPPAHVTARLHGLDGAADRCAAIYAPVPVGAVLRACPALDAGTRAPDILTPWAETRARLRDFMRGRGLPPDGVVLVSATALEREWCAAAGLAGAVSADTFFARAE
jgi:hypothetical protein